MYRCLQCHLGNGNNGIGDGVFLSTANGNTVDANYIGVNAAGSGLILNGRTPDGSVFNGRAIRLLNSSNNTIGRQIDQPEMGRA
jgi:hypothetical protein